MNFYISAPRGLDIRIVSLYEITETGVLTMNYNREKNRGEKTGEKKLVFFRRAKPRYLDMVSYF